MSQHIKNQMAKKGYEKVKGVAVLNDVIITETSAGIHHLTLLTDESTDLFNDELNNDDWSVYRLSIVIN